MITQEFKDFYYLHMGFGTDESGQKMIDYEFQGGKKYRESDQYYISEKCHENIKDISKLKLEDMEQPERMKFLLVLMAEDWNLDVTSSKVKNYLIQFKDELKEIKEYNKPIKKVK